MWRSSVVGYTRSSPSLAPFIYSFAVKIRIVVTLEAMQQTYGRNAKRELAKTQIEAREHSHPRSVLTNSEISEFWVDRMSFYASAQNGNKVVLFILFYTTFLLIYIYSKWLNIILYKNNIISFQFLFNGTKGQRFDLILSIISHNLQNQLYFSHFSYFYHSKQSSNVSAKFPFKIIYTKFVEIKFAEKFCRKINTR